ncbi:MAG: hypothetical protein MAG795_00966 [Candidatus Woesearchaeota archaeon]|nr:hypothetical protein [Candidatus Woesearchaeota archaeon]
MDDNFLLKISISTALIGLIILTLILFLRDYPVYNPVDKPSSQIVDVKLTGSVESVNNYGKISMVNLINPKTTKVLVFEDGILNVSLGEYIQVKGELQDDQVVAHQIEVLE